MKTAYYTDQDFEGFMSRSERKLKIQFYVWLVSSTVCQFGIWDMLLTDCNLSRKVQVFLLGISILALLGIIGLGYCYFSVRRNRLNYERMRREQQEETNALIDEVQSAYNKKAGR